MALTLECVTPEEYLKVRRFCLTDCGPSEGCNPDKECNPDSDCKPNKCRPSK